MAVLGLNTGSGMGVYGQSTSSLGVYGWSGTSYGGQFYSQSGTALRALGDAEVTGDLTVAGSVTGAYNTSLPIAYGVVNADGTKASGTSNVSSIWNSTRYDITISGHSYYYDQYVTTVTAISGCNYANTIRTSSASGRLLVYFGSGGSTVQCPFQFVTFKP
jgi:hypothetical protein